MHVLSLKPLREFWREHPGAELALRRWFNTAERKRWTCFADLRADFASADQVGRYTVFNIGGNKFRLIAVIHYTTGRLYVRYVLTHKDYDTGKWKQERGTP